MNNFLKNNLMKIVNVKEKVNLLKVEIKNSGVHELNFILDFELFIKVIFHSLKIISRQFLNFIYTFFEELR